MSVTTKAEHRPNVWRASATKARPLPIITSINGIHGLAPRQPVWKVELNVQPAAPQGNIGHRPAAAGPAPPAAAAPVGLMPIVVKCENIRPDQTTNYLIDLANQATSIAGTEITCEIMTSQELQVLATFCNGIVDNPDLKKTILDYLSLGASRTWIKMRYLNAIVTLGKDLGGNISRVDFSLDKAGVDRFIAVYEAIRENRLLRLQLGRIFAVDIFIDNNDRVGVNDTGKVMIVNSGNLVFETDGDGHIVKALGLDYLDPSSISTIGPTPEEWFTHWGKILQHKYMMKAFAEGFINDFNERLNLATIAARFKLKKEVLKLDLALCDDFAEGMVVATESMKANFINRHRGNRANPQEIGRAQILKWI